MKVKKIDIHVHSRKVHGVASLAGYVYPTYEELRSLYDRLGIEKGVNLPLGMSGPEGSGQIITNDEAYELATLHPETYFWFCGVDPRISGNSPKTDLSYFISYYKERGAKGVGELTANIDMDDPRVLNLFYHCEKCNMPVTIHIGNPGFGTYGLIDLVGLPRLEKVLEQFSKLIILGHSQRFWAEISGDCSMENRSGYPKGPVKPGGRVVELMRKYPNLHGDLSAGSGHNAITRDPEFGYAFLEEFQDRLYFGTDFTDPGQIEHPFAKLSSWLDEAYEQGNISFEVYEKVSRKNALRLLEGYNG
jgi:predicted TIM-barrel fold metal-dependent hydrolase